MALAEDGLDSSERPFLPPPLHLRGKLRGAANGRKKKPTTIPKGHVNAPPEIRARFGDAKVCTRARAAFILGISTTELERREKDGIYPHTRDNRGRLWFDEENLRRIAGDTIAARSERKHLHRPALVKESEVVTASSANPSEKVRNVQRNGYDAQTAARVFKELIAGKTIEEVVVDLEVHPDQAGAIYESFCKLRSYVVMKPEHFAKLAHLPLRGAAQPKTADEFVLMIRGTMECGLSKCAKCKESYARLCATCAASAKPPEPPAASISAQAPRAFAENEEATLKSAEAPAEKG